MEPHDEGTTCRGRRHAWRFEFGDAPQRRRRRELRRTLFWGLTLISAGAILFAAHNGVVDEDRLWRFWPALFALHGALTIAFATQLSHVLGGLFSIALGFWIYACLEHLWGWTFVATWPMVLIAAGAVMLVRGLLHRTDPRAPERTS